MARPEGTSWRGISGIAGADSLDTVTALRAQEGTLLGHARWAGVSGSALADAVLTLAVDATEGTNSLRAIVTAESVMAKADSSNIITYTVMDIGAFVGAGLFGTLLPSPS